jgi:hypothetical protein
VNPIVEIALRCCGTWIAVSLICGIVLYVLVCYSANVEKQMMR